MNRLSDTLVRLSAPTSKSGGVALDSAGGSTSLIRIFNDRKEAITVDGTTRLRTAIAAGITTWLVPHMVPAWLEVGDTVRIRDDEGRTRETTVVSYTPGTGVGTPATNFDTLVTALGPLAAADAGSPITLIKKASTAAQVPMLAKDQDFAVGDSIEVETDTPGTVDVLTTVGVVRTSSTEDGEAATNQAEQTLVQLTGGTTVAVSSGRRLRHKIGADIAMAQYGTVTSSVWDIDSDGIPGGWEGTIVDTLAGIETGQIARVEIHFTGAGGGLALVETLRDVVLEG